MYRREIKFVKAWDKRHKDSKKNYGVNGVDIRFFFHGPAGTIQFIVASGWMLKSVEKSLSDFYPMAMDLGYHSKTPKYEGHTVMASECDVIKGACYYDGSTLNAEPVLDRLVNEGDEGVWDELESYYAKTFEVK